MIYLQVCQVRVDQLINYRLCHSLMNRLDSIDSTYPEPPRTLKLTALKAHFPFYPTVCQNTPQPLALQNQNAYP